jgi:hypothetical protein
MLPDKIGFRKIRFIDVAFKEGRGTVLLSVAMEDCF